LSFYHDDFVISTGLLYPWTTLASVALLTALLILALRKRTRYPLFSIGALLFLACNLLTGTVIPLELVYEHRNYFASFGLMLAIVPTLCALPYGSLRTARVLVIPKRILLIGLLLLWSEQTLITAWSWGNPLRLSQTLADRAPDSPRAQYELGRTYILYSQYDPSSLFTKLMYAPLERAAALPHSSILPEQALIFANSRMRLPLKDSWWDSLIGKLKANNLTVQDESSLGALTQCNREGMCDLPRQRMMEAYMAALSHPHPSARLLSMYSDYAWNILDDKTLGLRTIEQAIAVAPSEPAYRITQIRMLANLGRKQDALAGIQQLQRLNYGGRLDDSLQQLRQLPGLE
jgi:hypothetical protein